MSTSWEALDAVPAEPCACPMCADDGHEAWEAEFDAEPWWLACGISTAGAVMVCALMFAAFAVAVLASGAH